MITKNILALKENLKLVIPGQEKPDKLTILFRARKRLQLVDTQLEYMLKTLKETLTELESCGYGTKLLNSICYALEKVQKGIRKEIGRMSE